MKIKLILWLTLFGFLAALNVNAQAYIGYVYPTGGKQGTSVEVVVGGQSLGDVKGVFVNGKEITGTIIEKIPVNLKEKNLRIKEQDIPQIEEMIKVRIDIGRKAEIGIHDFRLETENGYSNRIFFEVSELAEINEVEPNDKPATAFLIPKLPAVVNGQILPGERDCFRFEAKKGETIVCCTKARVLVPYLADAVPGWFQPVLTLRNAEGKEVAYNDDFGDNPDPVIICKIPENGSYTLEIKDAVYRGREDFVYRISIGETPFVRSVFPLGGEMGKKTQVTLDGVNLSKSRIKLNLKKGSDNKVFFTASGNKLHSNTLSFGTSSGPEVFENENNDTTHPLLMPLEYTVNGKISQPGEEDWFAIDGKKGQSIILEVLAHRLGSLLDADITLFNEGNKQVAQVDDFQDKSEGMETFHADPQMIYKFDKNGKVFIRIRDVLGKGGSAYGYRLFYGKPTPDFDLRINPSNLTINQGGTASFTLFALRKFNFLGEIKLQLSGLPAGFSHSNGVIKNGQNQLRMTITAPSTCKTGSLDLKIAGKSETKNASVERVAEPVEERMQAFFYQHLLPACDFLTTVTPPLPFSISHAISTDTVLVISKDTGLTIHVKIKRSEGFNLPVQIILDNPPKGVRMKSVIVPAGESEANVTIETNAALFNQSYSVVLSGVSRILRTKKTPAKIYKALSPAIMIETPKKVFKR